MEDLIKLAQQGNPEARQELLSRIRPQLRMWAEQGLNRTPQSRFDASDLTQQTLLEVHQRLDQFVGQTTGEFYSWLKAALKHNILDSVRDAQAGKRDIHREVSRDALADKPGTSPLADPPAEISTPSLQALRQEHRQLFQRAFDMLSPEHQTVVRLVHFEGHSIAEAAAIMGRTPAATAKLLQRAMANLHQNLMALGALDQL